MKIVEQKKKDKPKNGSISLKAGKATIVWQDKERDFGIFFVTDQMRRAIRNSRQGFYTDRIRGIAKQLESRGVFGIAEAKKRLEALSAGSDINKQYLKQIVSWLANIDMFKRMKTGGKQKTDYGKEYERIFMVKKKEPETTTIMDLSKIRKAA